ncbi:uncharacterized protein G2W53_000702 [Senna tora]|uniref:Uncharacterized protein n=1 Tax=Senna tora TaxID=362788 RepID=A0A835CLW7_9FABA|nr:uncharacterized protein G2W53_000702 [Senna tora]
MHKAQLDHNNNESLERIKELCHLDIDLFNHNLGSSLAATPTDIKHFEEKAEEVAQKKKVLNPKKLNIRLEIMERV